MPKFLTAAVALAIASLPAADLRGSDRLVVHEWGTFTVLQDENGQALGGINIDDEPLPKFVHNLNPYIFEPSSLARGTFSKAAPERHPLINLRLETPVIYFYPPQRQKLSDRIDVEVTFRGGWLTEFYPCAVANAPGLREGKFKFGPLTPSTVSTLAWKDLQIDSGKPGPSTDSRVWLAPRKTRSVSVSAPSGESEKYLFYRGVGNLAGPLRVLTKPEGAIQIHSNIERSLLGEQPLAMGPLWLVHIRKDRSSAFRTVRSETDQKKPLATVASTFDEQEYSTSNVERLCAAMQPVLVQTGLFDDEAAVLLATWQHAYFKSPGLRLFYLVPRVWTDHYLPLKLSTPAQVERVMIGRVELISPEQRVLLHKLREAKPSDTRWLATVLQSPAAAKFFSGHSDFGDLGVQIPVDYQLYLDLGRFRNSLLIQEEKRHPKSNLTSFINRYGLQVFRWDAIESAKQ